MVFWGGAMVVAPNAGPDAAVVKPALVRACGGGTGGATPMGALAYGAAVTGAPGTAGAAAMGYDAAAAAAAALAGRDMSCVRGAFSTSGDDAPRSAAVELVRLRLAGLVDMAGAGEGEGEEGVAKCAPLGVTSPKASTRGGGLGATNCVGSGNRSSGAGRS